MMQRKKWATGQGGQLLSKIEHRGDSKGRFGAKGKGNGNGNRMVRAKKQTRADLRRLKRTAKKQRKHEHYTNRKRQRVDVNANVNKSSQPKRRRTRQPVEKTTKKKKKKREKKKLTIRDAGDTGDLFDRQIEALNEKLGKTRDSDRLDGLDDLLAGISSAGAEYATQKLSDDDDGVDHDLLGNNESDSDDLSDNDDDDAALYAQYLEEKRAKKTKQAESESESDGELLADSSDDASDDDEKKNVQVKGSAYVPPHMRARESEVQQQMRALLNKISKGNFEAIVSESVQMFHTQSRVEVRETLVSRVLDACAATTQPESIVTYAAWVAVLHNRVGMEIGGELLQRLALELARCSAAAATATASDNDDDDDNDNFNDANAKRSASLAALLVHLYNFDVVHVSLVLDVAEMLVDRFTDTDVELLLLIIRSGGLKLRADDAQSLRNVIDAIEAKAGGVDSMPSRMRFMIDTIVDLRSNRQRLVQRSPDVQHYRTTLRHLVENASATIIKISWTKLIDGVSTKGRWWLLGSALAETDRHLKASSSSSSSMSSASSASSRTETLLAAMDGHGSDTAPAAVLKLARKQRMNTDTRRAIFCAIMSSQDYVDAFGKITQLHLKGKQDRDIVHVLLHCAQMETKYNRFYELLAAKLCVFDFNAKFTFQYAFWDKLRALADLSVVKISHLASLLAYLVSTHALSLATLKVVEFESLDSHQILFFRLFFARLFLLTDQQPDAVSKIFERVGNREELFDLVQGMLIFFEQLRTYLKVNDRSLLPNFRLARQILKSSSIFGI
jgi:nucleolar MIF4G domain-containing protein 1